MRPLFRMGLLAGAGLVALAQAQTELTGKDQFPQFRSMSMLSGGSFAVDRRGHPNFGGAMSLSTPIGYSLSDFRFVLGVGLVSTNSAPAIRFDRGRDKSRGGNGTVQGMIGLPLGSFGRATFGTGILSGIGDNVYNFQYQPPQPESNRIQWSLGVQDIFGDGGSAGEAIPSDGDLSRSFFAVGTAELSPGLHASLGVGTRRFRGVFGNASYSLTPWLKTTLEYDAFNWNYGVGLDVRELFRTGRGNEWSDEPRREANAVFHVGMIRGQYFYSALSVSF